MFGFRSGWTQSAIRLAGVLICVLAIAVLIGWQIHSLKLVQVLPGLAPMKRMTAAAFLLSGIALLFLSAGRKWAARACAAVVLALGVAVCVEYAFGADFGIDQLLGPDYVLTHTSNPGRMSPVAALCFIAAGFAVLAATSRQFAKAASSIVGIIASMLLAVGTVSLLGYLLGHSETYGWSHFTRLALHTSAAFALLGGGLLVWAWQGKDERQGAPEWLPLSIGTGLAAGALGMWQALTADEESKLPLLSGIILAGGLVSAFLVAIAIAQAQKARQRSRELQEGKEMMDQLFEASPDGLILTDHQGRILQVSRLVESTFGYSREELLGHPIESLVPLKLREQHENHRNDFNARPETRPMGRGLELHARRKNGSEFPVDVSLSVPGGNEHRVLAVVRDISERKLAETALRESEAAFITLADSVPQMVWMCTPDGLNVYFNQRWVDYTGLTLQESYGKGWNTPFHPDEKQAAFEAWNRATATGETYRVESRLRAADGSYRWFLMRGVPLRNGAGNIIKWFGTCTDIDDLKRTEQKLKESEARLQLQIDRMPISCIVFNKELRILSWNPAAEQLFGFNATEVIGRHAYDCIVPPHLKPQIDSVVARLLEGDETAHSTNENLTKDGRQIVCAWTNTPLRGADGKIGGILSMVQDITARKQAEEALRQSEESFRKVFEEGPVGLALVGTDYRILKANTALCEMLGYREAELSGMMFRDFTHPDDPHINPSIAEPLFTGEVPFHKMEKRYFRKNGEILWGNVTASAIRDNQGKPLYGVAMIEDITDRKRAETQVRLGNEIFAHMEEAVCLIRVEDGIIVQANQKFEKMFGYSPGELIGQRVEDLNADPHRSPEQVAEEIRQEIKRSGVWRGEIQHRRKDGTLFWCAVTGSVFHHPEFGHVGISIHQDITELKQAQETLRESEERFRSLFEQGPLGYVLMGMDRRMIKVNAACCRMLGYSERELTCMSPLEITHPEDRVASIDLMERLFQRGDSSGKIEKRYVRKSGEIIWATLTVSVIRDREGKPLYSVGLIEDITERRRAEAEVRLGSEIFAHMEEAVCLVRMRDGVIVHANPKFEQMFGYEPNELAGKPVEGINSAAAHSHPEEVADEITAEVRRCGVWRGEVLHQQKDGTPFWCAVTVSMFHHPEFGEVGISLHQDITELKQAQEALVESEERFRGVFEQGPIGVALLDNHKRMIKSNPEFRRMLGYTEDELAEMTPLDMTYPEDRAVCGELFRQLDDGELPVCKTEKRYRKKNGDIMWASLTASVIRDGQGRPLYGLGMIEDVTERRQSQEKLAEQAALLALARDSIAVRDLEGRIIFWNRGAQETYGWSAEEALGRMGHELLQTKYPVPLSEIERLVLSQGGWEGEFEQVTRDGETIFVISRWSLWRDENGAPKAILVINRDITARKKDEEQLHSLTERLFLATRIASIGVWDRDLRTNQVVWDDTLFEIFGMPKTVPMTYEDFARRVHPEDLARVEASLDRTIKEKVHDVVEFRIVRPDGSVRYVTSAQGVVLNESGEAVRLVGTGADITERKEAEEQLRSLSERLALATRTSSIAIWDLDLQTGMVVWDDLLFEIVGIPKMIPMPRKEFTKRVHPEDLARVQASLQRVVTGKSQEFIEFRIIRPDGSIRHVSAAQGAVPDEQGRVVRVVGTCVDITDRKRMEAQIETNKAQLVTSARLSALGMMAGNIAHEINNPVGIIHALSSNLIDMVEQDETAPPEMVTRNARRIRETSERIAGIVKSLLQIAREGSSDRFFPVRIGKILNETLEICRERFRSNGVKLILPADLPQISVSCREVQIAQVLLNLLQNAFDAVVDQSGERWVRVDVTPQEDSLVVSVTDSGPGIPTDLRSRIMEPFFTTKPVGKGTGLGLSLSKTIAEEHGGRLEYGEDRGRTRFSLSLPLVHEAEAAWS
jgi:PAS domain S-box-containing protein